MARRARPSILLVREWEQQLGTSSCCSHLEESGLHTAPCFPERRDRMESLGPLYRAIVARYGDEVEVQVVDPRNLLTLLPVVLRDLWSHGGSLGQAIRTLRRVSFQTVIVNGRILSRGAWPEPDTVFSILDSLLARGAA